MALHRVTKFSQDWRVLAKILSKEKIPAFQVFKSKSESNLTKVLSLPSELPKIDWENYYKVLDKDFVSQMEKMYKSVKIPYPKDILLKEIDALEKERMEQSREFCIESEKTIKLSEKQLYKWKDIIPLENLYVEEIHDAFPDNTINLWERPTFIPHDYPFEPHPENVPGLHPGGGEGH
ncbi:unnamed protein product [Gordionus sp. m RMFG-2023]|uniref:ATP synthase subunit d, mitochondrial-like n=1 Tax=Gordionus sp. m RMFG-2023 TaxID=3053472 RepID=UPI0030E428A8